MQELYELIAKDVAREARLASARWNGMTDADDIEQELWLWIMERPGTQRFFKSAETGQIRSALTSRANDICSKSNLAYDHFSGQYTYTPAEVRELLTTYFGTDVSEVSAAVMELAESELSETMISNILGGVISPDEKMDVEQGLQVLEETHPQYYFVLMEAYRAGIEPEHRTTKTRAVDKLTTIMNRKRSQRETDRHEGLGTKPKNTNNPQEN